MRPLTIAGLVLILAGAFVLLNGGLSTRRDEVSVGGVTISAEQKRMIPPWVSALAIAAGLALAVHGQQRKKQ